jgi:hypothetical protein
VVGLLPLYLERHRRAGGLIVTRKLRQIGVGGDTAPDELGGLFLPEHEQAASLAMARFLVLEFRQWDMLDLSDLRSDSLLTRALDAELRAAGLRVSCVPSEPITFGRLPGSWDECRKGMRLSRREILGRKRRKFEALPGAGTTLVKTDSELAGAFERLAELHRLRWTGRTERPGFSTPQYRGFHYELMQGLLRQGQLRLLGLELEGRTTAMIYGMQYKGRFCFFQSGFDPAYAAYSPGDVLMGYAVELAINQGCEIFDMLKGDHECKRHFFQDSRQNLELGAFRRGLVDAAYRLHDALRSVRGALRKRPPKHGSRGAAVLPPGTHQLVRP